METLKQCRVNAEEKADYTVNNKNNLCGDCSSLNEDQIIDEIGDKEFIRCGFYGFTPAKTGSCLEFCKSGQAIHVIRKRLHKDGRCYWS